MPCLRSRSPCFHQRCEIAIPSAQAVPALLVRTLGQQQRSDPVFPPVHRRDQRASRGGEENDMKRKSCIMDRNLSQCFEARETLGSPEFPACKRDFQHQHYRCGGSAESLSASVFPRHHSASRALPGSVGRRSKPETNTVLSNDHAEPVEYQPLCPWFHNSAFYTTLSRSINQGKCYKTSACR